jgi:hypothetical protein
MSRSGYSDDCGGWGLIMWRGAVASAIRGKRGQAFLREMLTVLDAMPVKRLITDELEHQGEVCAIGSVGVARGIDMSELNAENADQIGETFGIAPALVKEIEFMNDDGWYFAYTPEKRWLWVRNWVAKSLAPPEPVV